MGLLMGKRVLAYNDLGTFPIWGYGLVHLLFKSKLNILIFQQLLNFIPFIEVDRFLIKVEKVKNINFSRCLMLISLPLFFFHTQMWPKIFSDSVHNPELESSIIFFPITSKAPIISFPQAK